MHKMAVDQLAQMGGQPLCEIRPAWDGTGSYVVVVQAGGGDGPPPWLLTRNDGVPYRFPDPVAAQRKAVQCGVPSERIGVRWPPVGDEPVAAERAEEVVDYVAWHA